MNKNKQASTAVRKKKNPLLIIAAITVLVGIAVGVTLGVISCVASVNAVMEYEGVRLDKKTAAYLTSIHKNTYLAENKGTDTVGFWQTKRSDGKTHDTAFRESAEKYMRELVVGARLFDRYSKLTDEMEETVKKSAAKVAEYYYRTEGFEKLFEADAAAMGYDYEAFEKAAMLLYKSSMARSAVYGENGSEVSKLVGECSEYLKKTYTHVEFLFLRTETTYVMDGGKRVTNPDGTYQVKVLTAEEREARNAAASRLDSLIEAYYSDSADGAEKITPEVIRNIASEFVSDQSEDRINKGYYFSPYSEYTESFMSQKDLIPALEAAFKLELDVGGNAYGGVTLTLTNEVGERESVRCFIYKSEVAANAYRDAELSDFFTDFYSDAADYVHAKTIKTLSDDVKVKDAFYELDLVAIPHNDKHVLRY